MNERPYQARDHSYEVERTVPVGSRVRLIRDVRYYGVIPAGRTGVLESYSNAGERGILASVYLDEPVSLYGVAAQKYLDSRRELGIEVSEPDVYRLPAISAGLLERVP